MVEEWVGTFFAPVVRAPDMAPRACDCAAEPEASEEARALSRWGYAFGSWRRGCAPAEEFVLA